MLYQVSDQIFRNFLNANKFVLILLAVVLIFGCNQNRGKDFIKLDAPLEEVLPQIVLIAPEQQDKNGQPLEITVGSTFSGEGEYGIGDGETHGFRWTFFNQHAVEGNRYIFAVTSYNWGGSGTFYYLTVVDKTTLKSVSEVLLGDRVKIESVALTAPNTDSVSVNYMDRESGTAMADTPDKAVEKHFKMDQEQLKEMSPKN